MAAYSIKDNDQILDFKKYVFKIKDMPIENQPLEKLFKHGPSALSVVELLAVILTTGSKKEGVMEMAGRVLKEYGEKALMSQKDARAIAKDLNIPEIKALQIVACSELGRRFFEKNDTGPALIRNAKDVFEHLREMRALPKEHLRGLYLNSHHKVIHDEVISIGTINSNLIHPREVFAPAIQYGAAGIILAHNHPSGSITPSQADIEITKQLVEVGKIIGINLLDHVIVSKEGFASIDIDYLS